MGAPRAGSPPTDFPTRQMTCARFRPGWGGFACGRNVLVLPSNDSQTIRDRLLSRRTLIQAGGATAIAAVASADRFMVRPHFVSAQSIATIAANPSQSGTDFN